MATLIRTDGLVLGIEPENGEDFKLEELQQMVDGLIEIVPIHGTEDILVIDEEGKLKDKLVNEVATELCHGFESIAEWDCIAGDALLCNTKQVK